MSKRFRVRFAYDTEVDAESPLHAVQVAVLQIAEDIPDEQIVCDLMPISTEELAEKEVENNG